MEQAILDIETYNRLKKLEEFFNGNKKDIFVSRWCFGEKYAVYTENQAVKDLLDQIKHLEFEQDGYKRQTKSLQDSLKNQKDLNKVLNEQNKDLIETNKCLTEKSLKVGSRKWWGKFCLAN